jgi:hypothetical protein
LVRNDRRPEVERPSTVVVGAKVETGLKRDLEELAHANDRTLSGEVRLALRRHLAYEWSAPTPTVQTSRARPRASRQAAAA